MNWGLILGIGLLAGILSGLFGVGGGTVLVPLFLYLLKMDIHVATGTSLAVIIPTALFGALNHANSGQVNWKIAAVVAVFCVLGSFIGVRMNVALPSYVLQKVFSVFLLVISIQLFFK